MLKRPGLALFLSLLPGTGQVYNGLIARGIAQFVVWFFLMWLVGLKTGIGPVIAIVMLATWIWCAVDARSTAQTINATGRLPSPDEARAVGELPVPGLADDRRVLGTALIAVGGLIVLAQLGLAHWIGRFIVPLGLIAVGIWLVRRSRFEPDPRSTEPPPMD